MAELADLLRQATAYFDPSGALVLMSRQVVTVFARQLGQRSIQLPGSLRRFGKLREPERGELSASHRSAPLDRRRVLPVLSLGDTLVLKRSW